MATAVLESVRPASLFGVGWSACPHCGCGVPLDALRPCSCGSTEFLVVEGGGFCRKLCAACYGNPRLRMARPDDRVIGSFDAATGGFGA
jgi:hypothetical protein